VRESVAAVSTPNTDWSASMERVAAPLREQVSNVLRQAILDFELQPGQRLVERELTDRLQVSRTTIRESLRELTAEGLVQVIPQRGAVVATISREDATDLYDARIAIECLIVTRFIERADEQHVQRLRSATARFREATAAGRSTREVLTIKDEFYDELIAGARSPVLANLLGSLHARVSVLRATSMSQPGRPLKAVEEIETLTEAIARRDAKAASKACTTHIKNAAKAGMRENPETHSESNGHRSSPSLRP
jgi:DNA-binding GntR family transcriptional regulator